jgi:hypothetical protein
MTPDYAEEDDEFRMNFFIGRIPKKLLKNFYSHKRTKIEILDI